MTAWFEGPLKTHRIMESLAGKAAISNVPQSCVGARTIYPPLTDRFSSDSMPLSERRLYGGQQCA